MSTEQDGKRKHRSMDQGMLAFVKLLSYKRRELIFDRKRVVLATQLIWGILKQKHPLVSSAIVLQIINSREFCVVLM